MGALFELFNIMDLCFIEKSIMIAAKKTQFRPNCLTFQYLINAALIVNYWENQLLGEQHFFDN